MIGELQETNWKLSKTLLALQSHCSNTIPMEVRMRNVGSSTTVGTSMRSSGGNSMDEEMKRQRDREREYRRSFSHPNGKKPLRSSYFSLESMLLLVCLTASLLILPLILPPLPPPPFLLLLLPIGILGLLMILAFMPYNVRDLTYTYM